MIRSLESDHTNHYESTLGMHCGSWTFARPCLGSWVSYGLGTENRNLPSFMVIAPAAPYAGAQTWASDFLPGCHQGTHITPGAEPIPNVKPRVASSKLQELELELLASANRQHLAQHPSDAALDATIRSFETAFGMQHDAPEAFDLSGETAQTLAMYGLDARANDRIRLAMPRCARLAERGVRFIELIDVGSSNNWDSHGNMADHERLAKNVDQPIAALLKDLKLRGMLDETLVVWTTEFGRTPYHENAGHAGREHHHQVFSSWLAGGGVKGGLAYGSSDDYGIAVGREARACARFSRDDPASLGPQPRAAYLSPRRPRLSPDRRARQGRDADHRVAYTAGEMNSSFVLQPPGGVTILAALRQFLPGTSWSAARKLLAARRVLVNDVLCLDEGRRLSSGDRVAIAIHSLRAPPAVDAVKIDFIDQEIVVVEKPAGMMTLRRHEELAWPAQRRRMQPTLDEAVAQRIAEHAARKAKRTVGARLPRLYAVHRLDRDTSGIIVFARDTAAQSKLIAQFAAHTAVRKYLAIVRGAVPSQTIRSQIVRNRGDGLRGGTSDEAAGQLAITHVTPLRQLGGHCELQCRLETGRTNQIRIHLAELGHPVCGDVKYRGRLGEVLPPHECGAPRLALHSTQLHIEHPTTGESLTYDSPWPMDIAAFVAKLASG